MQRTSKSNLNFGGDAVDLACTPGGYRPKEKVHLIENTHQVSIKDGLARKIAISDKSILENFGKMNVPDSNTTGIKNSISNRSIQNSDVLSEEELINRPITDQWIIYSKWENSTGSPIVYFSTKWVVPEPPTSENDQLIYLFNGLESKTGSYIIQPVLQWGVSIAGGGSHWSISNWFVGFPNSGIAFYGPLFEVYPNQELHGLITAQKQINGLFTYRSSFENIPNSELVIIDCEELVLAFETLECYKLTEFSDYPNSPSTEMREIEIRLEGHPITIEWEPYNQVVDNGQWCEIVSNASPGGIVNLHYKGINQLSS
jgi:hypothetical protein